MKQATSQEKTTEAAELANHPENYIEQKSEVA
jgi:hypothetical protein